MPGKGNSFHLLLRPSGGRFTHGASQGTGHPQCREQPTGPSSPRSARWRSSPSRPRSQRRPFPRACPPTSWRWPVPDPCPPSSRPPGALFAPVIGLGVARSHPVRGVGGRGYGSPRTNSSLSWGRLLPGDAPASPLGASHLAHTGALLHGGPRPHGRIQKGQQLSAPLADKHYTTALALAWGAGKDSDLPTSHDLDTVLSCCL